MPSVPVYDFNKNQVGEVNLSSDIFGVEVKKHLFYDIIRMQLAAKRGGNASTKTRSDVAGGGRKPWKQKGTGRARVGTIRSPLWRGGGTVFGPHPRDYSLKVNKKVKKSAMKSALTLKVNESRFVVLKDLNLPEIKTKQVESFMKLFELKNALVLLDAGNENFELSARNLKSVKVVPVEGLNLFDLLKYENVVLTEPSVKKIEGAYSNAR